MEKISLKASTNYDRLTNIFSKMDFSVFDKVMDREVECPKYSNNGRASIASETKKFIIEHMIKADVSFFTEKRMRSIIAFVVSLDYAVGSKNSYISVITSSINRREKPLDNLLKHNVSIWLKTPYTENDVRKDREKKANSYDVGSFVGTIKEFDGRIDPENPDYDFMIVLVSMTTGARHSEIYGDATFEKVKDAPKKIKITGERPAHIRPIIELSSTRVIQLVKLIRERRKNARRGIYVQSKLLNILTADECRKGYASVSFDLFGKEQGFTPENWGKLVFNLSKSAQGPVIKDKQKPLYEDKPPSLPSWTTDDDDDEAWLPPPLPKNPPPNLALAVSLQETIAKFGNPPQMIPVFP